MGTIFSHTYLYNPSLNQSSAENLIIRVIYVVFTLGLFGLRGKGGEVEGSRVKLVENRLILDQIYFTLLYFSSLPPQSK